MKYLFVFLFFVSFGPDLDLDNDGPTFDLSDLNSFIDNYKDSGRTIASTDSTNLKLKELSALYSLVVSELATDFTKDKLNASFEKHSKSFNSLSKKESTYLKNEIKKELSLNLVMN